MSNGVLIQDCGRWDWRLTVTSEGEVEARQPVPYDGVTVHSTEERVNRPHKQSQYELDARDVVRRFAAESETGRAFGDLVDDVQVALAEVEPR